MSNVTIYTTTWCGYCQLAKQLLTAKPITFTEVDLTNDPAFRQRLHDATGRWTVPQIVVDGALVGGFSELRRLELDGRLDHLLAGQPSLVGEGTT